MTSIRGLSLVGVLLAGLLVATGCSDGSSKSAPTTVPATPVPDTAGGPGLTFPPGEVSVWQCQDGRQLRLEGDGQWHFEGDPLNPGGATDPRFIAELFQCHGTAVRP